MKLIIQSGRVVASAFDDYVVQGWEQAVIDAPADYNDEKMGDYLFVEGNLTLPIQAEIVTATQQRLDDFARTRNYDGILSACTYATSTVPKFAAEGQYCVEARDATWAKLYEILAEVEAGSRPMPSGYADIEPLLPVLEWPA